MRDKTNRVNTSTTTRTIVNNIADRLHSIFTAKIQFIQIYTNCIKYAAKEYNKQCIDGYNSSER